MQPRRPISSEEKKATCMAESSFAIIQRRQIEITVGELLLTADYYRRQEIAERLRHLIAHADPSLDLALLTEGAREELAELGILDFPPKGGDPGA